MKKLGLPHVFKMSRLIKKAKLKEALSDVIVEASNPDADKTKIGVDIAFRVMDACCEEGVEQQLYDLLNDVTGKKIEEMALDEVMEAVKEIAKENNLLSFFRSAGALTEK